MDEIVIKNLLKCSQCFRGTFARDELPETIPINSGLIANTDTSDKPGTHWVCLYRADNGYCEYFDPFGLSPQYEEFKDFLNRNSKLGFIYNNQQLQCIDCITCGYYCVSFFKYRCKGFSLYQYICSYKSDPYINEKIVRKRVNQYSKLSKCKRVN